MRGLRMPPELETAIDAWIERQPDSKPSRSEAIRRLIEKGLGWDSSQEE
jgi:Arc/MetJ-type ribon-helix-helix transcriptional regulator